MSVCKPNSRFFLFLPLQIKIQMVYQTEIFDLNVHMHEGFDCNDVHLESGNLVKANSWFDFNVK